MHVAAQIGQGLSYLHTKRKDDKRCYVYISETEGGREKEHVCIKCLSACVHHDPTPDPCPPPLPLFPLLPMIIKLLPYAHL